MKLFDLSGKTVLVTGAGANGGIGHALALGFARAGARMAVADINDPGLTQTQQELMALGTKPVSAHCDISEPEQVAALFDAIDREFGRLDVLINVPFYFPRRVKPHELELADWERMLAVNMTGYFLCCQQALRRMLTAGSGAIINIGSNAGELALGRGAF